MIPKIKFSRFWKLSIGLVFLGLGQRLFYTGIVSPWTMDRAFPVRLAILHLLALVIGLLFIVPLIIWFYRQHYSDKRLLKLISFYLLSAIFAGVVIGGIGQILYDDSSFSYQEVKTSVWAISTIIQSILKLILIFGLVSIHKQLPILKRKDKLQLPLIGVICITVSLICLYCWLPMVGTAIVPLVDALVVIFTFYYFNYHLKEMMYEKIS